MYLPKITEIVSIASRQARAKNKKSDLSSNPKFSSKEQQTTPSGASAEKSEYEATIKSSLKRQLEKSVKKPKQSSHEGELLLAEAEHETKSTIQRCIKETDPENWKIKIRWLARLTDVFRDTTEVK